MTNRPANKPEPGPERKPVPGRQFPLSIGALGEFGLIARLTAGLPSSPDVLVGAGDDSAVLEVGGGQVLLATCDAQLDGQHFLRAVATPEQIGRRAMAVNLSDIASMGGTPRFALVSLLLSPDLPASLLDGVYRGLRQEAARSGVVIVGGNVTASPDLLGIDITVLGQMPREQVLLRSGARPGDALLVTGTLGAAAAGLHLLLHPELAVSVPESIAHPLKAAQLTPVPRVPEGRLLALLGSVTAMLDISDGLAGDLGHLCAQSRVGARLDQAALPISAATQEAARLAGQSALEWALYGGEDYQLLFTAPQLAVSRIKELLWLATGTLVSVIGEMLPPEAGMQLCAPDGTVQPLAARGWDHLREQPHP
jgi:thiamine-monophosphate kinase